MYKGDTLYRCSEERMKDKLEAFSEGGSDALVRTLAELGADVTRDDLGNVYATISGSDANGKRIVISCPDLTDEAGLCAAAEVAETVVTEEIPHKHSLTVLLWNGESAAKAPELVPAMGIICVDYLPEDVKRDYKADMLKPRENGEKKHRLNTHGYTSMFEVRTDPAVKNGVGIADTISYSMKRKRSPLDYNKKLTKLAADSAADCGIACETVHISSPRDNGTAAYMLPTAVILAGARNAVNYTQAANVLLTAVLQADKL